MGCGSSTSTTVRPLTAGEPDGEQGETGSKYGGRGDSAVSKGTTDSGVVMENKEIPMLPGAVPRKLPPLTSESVRESKGDRIKQDATQGLLQQDSTVQERQKSSEILEELLIQGIIPVGKTAQRSNITGEAYSIMLGEDKYVRRKPPARLESLKAKNTQNLPSKADIDEKIRLVEERRKLREDELKMRLRTMSARVRVRVPISNTEEEEYTSLTPVNPPQSPLTCDPTISQAGDCVRGAESGDRQRNNEKGKVEMTNGSEMVRACGDNTGESTEWVSEDGNEMKEEEEEEGNQVKELQEWQLLTASGELESDSSFQCADDKEVTF